MSYRVSMRVQSYDVQLEGVEGVDHVESNVVKAYYGEEGRLFFFVDEDLSGATASLKISQDGRDLHEIKNGRGTDVDPAGRIAVYLSGGVTQLQPLPGNRRIFDMHLWIRNSLEGRTERAFSGTLILARN